MYVPAKPLTATSLGCEGRRPCSPASVATSSSADETGDRVPIQLHASAKEYPTSQRATPVSLPDTDTGVLSTWSPTPNLTPSYPSGTSIVIRCEALNGALCVVMTYLPASRGPSVI